MCMCVLSVLYFKELKLEIICEYSVEESFKSFCFDFLLFRHLNSIVAAFMTLKYKLELLFVAKQFIYYLS